MITVVDYDPAWPQEFERTAADLASVAPESWVIEHIGSTSVPGLAAKPVIDLAVRVDTLDQVVALLPQLQAIGWYRLKTGPSTHRVLVKINGEERTHIAHFFPAEQWDSLHQRAFRDWLRTHPADRDRYAEAKRRAASAAESGRDYTLRKREVVSDITNRARAARGLLPVSDWDG